MIKKFRLRGFQSHADSELDLDPGVNVIVGPTDSGKSSLVRALGWLVFNRPRGDGFVNKKSKTCDVTVETDGGEAVRARKPSNEYLINGASLTAVGTTVPDDLQNVAFLDDVNFQWQLDPYFLVLESPGAISRYVTAQLGLDTVDVAIKSLRAAQAKLSGQLDALKQTHEESAAELERLSCLDSWVTRLEEAKRFDELIAAVTEKRNDLEQLSGRVDDASTALLALSGVEDKLDLFEASELRDRLSDVCKMASSFSSRLKELERSEALYEKAVDAFSLVNETIVVAKERYITELKTLGVCPTCFSDVDEATLERVVSRL